MWIAHPADRLNVVRGLTAPAILFAPFCYGFPDGYSACALTVLCIFVLIGSINYTLHLHIHRPFATKKWLNLLLDLSMGLTTGMTASNWRIQHRYGHHRGLDKPYRPDRAWETAEYSARGALSYTIRSIWPTFWQPIAESFRKGILANVTTPVNYRWAIAEQGLLAAVVFALLAWQPILVLVFLLPWYWTIYFISRYVDYLNHYGCDERSGNWYECANNSLNKLFNRSSHNFGYHTAHHLRPTAHWTELPEIHARIAHRIPAPRLKEFSWSCLLLPYHCVRARHGKM
jgi:fatty acid desaturase